MIISWNVRGLNKAGKFREISSRLQNLNPAITVLIETRVKEKNADRIRKKMKLNGYYLDNYPNHENGRIWLQWDDSRRHIDCIHSTDQMLHCRVTDAAGVFMFWMTAVYAHNQLNRRKTLWQDIVKIYTQQTGPWVLIGDFNNVLKAEDRIGGTAVTENEYIDIVEMMSNAGLYEVERDGDYFTWSNKQGENVIYSRIDHVLCNAEWMQTNENTTVTNMPPSISDHSMIILDDHATVQKPGKCFKFVNCCAEMDNFQETVENNWNLPLDGRPMFVVWKKLQRLQPHIKKLCRPLSDMSNKITHARDNLTNAQ